MATPTYNPRGRPTTLPDIPRVGTRRCTQCTLHLPLTEFYRNSRSRDSLQKVCKGCQKERIRQRYASEEQRKAANAAYMREWRRKRRQRPH